MVDYLSHHALQNLRHYKYSAVDRSPLSKYVLQHYWNWAVTLFPMWMAPNLITLIGFGFIWFNLLLILIFVPDLEGPGPSWIYFSFAIGIWLYSTFDNVDGKQARRTGTSSPLGELFDHGCDALNCSVGAIVQAASLGLGCTWYTFAVTFMTTLNFYASTWEEYHTGTLYLGYINGPTEGLTMACIMSVISGIKGPKFWHQPAANLIPEFLAIFPLDYTLIDYSLIGLLVLLFGTCVPMSIYSVYKTTRAQYPRVPSRPSRPLYTFRQSMAQVLPMCLFLICNGVWLMSPYSVALHTHVILFTIANGIVFGRMATKIILAHVTMMEFPVNSTGMLIPLGLGTVLVTVPYFSGTIILTPELETIYIWLYFIVAAINYIHWALLVINKFCDHLSINCLTIRKNETSAGVYQAITNQDGDLASKQDCELTEMVPGATRDNPNASDVVLVHSKTSVFSPSSGYSSGADVQSSDRRRSKKVKRSKG